VQRIFSFQRHKQDGIGRNLIPLTQLSSPSPSDEVTELYQVYTETQESLIEHALALCAVYLLDNRFVIASNPSYISLSSAFQTI